MFDQTYQNNSMSCRSTQTKRRLIAENEEIADRLQDELDRPDVYPKDVLWMRAEYTLENEAFREWLQEELVE